LLLRIFKEIGRGVRTFLARDSDDPPERFLCHCFRPDGNIFSSDDPHAIDSGSSNHPEFFHRRVDGGHAASGRMHECSSSLPTRPIQCFAA
jgi:hypothetical protein